MAAALTLVSATEAWNQAALVQNVTIKGTWLKSPLTYEAQLAEFGPVLCAA